MQWSASTAAIQPLLNAGAPGWLVALQGGRRRTGDFNPDYHHARSHVDRLCHCHAGLGDITATGAKLELMRRLR